MNGISDPVDPIILSRYPTRILSQFFLCDLLLGRRRLLRDRDVLMNNEPVVSHLLKDHGPSAIERFFGSVLHYRVTMPGGGTPCEISPRVDPRILSYSYLEG